MNFPWIFQIPALQVELGRLSEGNISVLFRDGSTRVNGTRQATDVVQLSQMGVTETVIFYIKTDGSFWRLHDTKDPNDSSRIFSHFQIEDSGVNQVSTSAESSIVYTKSNGSLNT